ncbi:MAG TPA: hypothetical protein VMR18_02175 [Candidatus Saccharimonadales bacterium]|nr:hypothetical protein [Candidatus Saccharimonadales bacterium]
MFAGVAIGAGLKTNNKPLLATTSSSKTKPTSQTSVSADTTPATNSTPAAISSTSTTKTTTTPSTSVATTTPATTTPSQPATLAGCTYTNGPQAGQGCPVSPPTSYSSSNAYPYSCNMPDPSNPGYVTNYPGGCPPYTDVTSIVGTGSGSASYCQFNYSTYNGTSGIQKSDRVNNYSNTVPDCSTATLYY